MVFAVRVDIPHDAQLGDRISFPPYLVTRADIARFAHSFGSKTREYFDNEYARSLGWTDVVAPLGYYVTIRHQTASLLPLDDLSEDGMPPDLTPSTPYTRRAAGGSRLRFHDRFVAGDHVNLTKELIDVENKAGRQGPLAAVTHELRYSTARGLAVVEHFVRILR